MSGFKRSRGRACRRDGAPGSNGGSLPPRSSRAPSRQASAADLGGMPLGVLVLTGFSTGRPERSRPQSPGLEFRSLQGEANGPPRHHHLPPPSDAESSGAAVAAAVVVVTGAAWPAAAAVESVSASASGSGSRPGVLLRGPGGESCRMGLRPGTARDFFPIASPNASRERRQSRGAGARRGAERRCVINIHTQ